MLREFRAIQLGSADNIVTFDSKRRRRRRRRPVRRSRMDTNSHSLAAFLEHHTTHTRYYLCDTLGAPRHCAAHTNARPYVRPSGSTAVRCSQRCAIVNHAIACAHTRVSLMKVSRAAPKQAAKNVCGKCKWDVTLHIAHTHASY